MTAGSSLFRVGGGAAYVPTDLARGPWQPDLLHGGAVAALLAELLHGDVTSGFEPARLTLSFVRPLYAASLSSSIEVVRRGRRMESLHGELRSEEGAVVIGSLLAVAPGDAGASDGEGADDGGAGPDDLPAVSLTLEAPSFLGHGMEVRYVEPREGFEPSGWFRLVASVIPDHSPSPLARVAAAADLTAAVAMRRGETLARSAIDADIVVGLVRPLRGEWVRLSASALWGPGACGQAVATVVDERGPLGTASCVLIEQAGMEREPWSPRRWTRVEPARAASGAVTR